MRANPQKSSRTSTRAPEGRSGCGGSFRLAGRAGALAAFIAGLLVFVTVAPGFCSDPIQYVVGTRGITWSRGSAQWLSEWLRGNEDLVFLGRFQSWSRDSLRPSEGFRVRCKIDTVLMGYSPDSTAEFMQLERPVFDPSVIRPGTPVLGRLARRCTTLGAPCGGFMLIGEEGVLLSDHISGDQLDERQEDSRPLRLVDLATDVLSRGGLAPVLRESEGLATAYLIQPSRTHLVSPSRTESSNTWQCVDLDWMVRARAPAPSYVQFRSLGACYTEFQGARFLLPIPKAFRGDTLVIEYCPRVLVVRAGEVQALGVPLDALPRMLVPLAGGGFAIGPAAIQTPRKRPEE